MLTTSQKRWLDRHVFVDVETGGFDPERHALLEVALVSGDGERALSTLVRPVGEVSPEALAVNGLDPDDCARRGRPPAEVAGLISRWLRLEEARLEPREDGSTPHLFAAGSRPAFDLAFLQQLFRRTQIEPPRLLSSRALDTGAMFAGLSAAGVAPWPPKALGLDHLVDYFDLQVGQRHRAYDDARAARQAVVAMLDHDYRALALLRHGEPDPEPQPAPADGDGPEVPAWLCPPPAPGG